MTTVVIMGPQSLSSAIGELREAAKAAPFLRVSWRVAKDRSSLQNALSHTWYEQIATELREDTPVDVKAECKLRYGVPILRAEEPEFRDAYDAVLKPLSYEAKLRAMHYWPVTSLMSTTQLSQYLDVMRDAYAGRVDLQFPDEWRWAA